MRVGMIQSNYIPWRGYFDFIASVDVFAFYDDVPYGRGKKWRNRNKIKTIHGEAWLTVPLEAHHSDKLIQDVRISYGHDWIARHLALIRESYRIAPFYERYVPRFEDIISRRFEKLSDLNFSLCRWICSELEITTTLRYSSEFQICADKFHRPALIAKALGATFYLTGPNTLAYTEAEAFAPHGVQLEVKSYEYANYPQQWAGFSPYVSILDLLFNVGPKSKNYIRSSVRNRSITPLQ